MKTIQVISNLPAHLDEALAQVCRIWRFHGWNIALASKFIPGNLRVVLVADSLYSDRDWLGKFTVGLSYNVIELNNRYNWVDYTPKWYANWNPFRPSVRDIRPILAHEIGHAFGLTHVETHRHIMDQFAASSLPWAQLRFPFYDSAL